MACGCSKATATTTGFLTSGAAETTRVGDPVVAAATGRYEVLTDSGSPSGRTFTSLVLAEQFARRIRGSVRPA